MRLWTRKGYDWSHHYPLIVEDDPLEPECLADLLKREGLDVVECANAAVAELVLASTGPELRALVTDVKLGGGDVRRGTCAVCQAPIP